MFYIFLPFSTIGPQPSFLIMLPMFNVGDSKETSYISTTYEFLLLRFKYLVLEVLFRFVRWMNCDYNVFITM